MSKTAYLVFAYKNPQLLKRAIRMLSTEHSASSCTLIRKLTLTSSFASAAKTSFSPTSARSCIGQNSPELKRLCCSFVKRSLDPERYDHFVLLSGSEYPLRSGRYIHDVLENNQGCNFISLLKTPSPGKPISRINTLRFESDKPVRRLGWRIFAKVVWRQRIIDDTWEN